MKYLVICIFLIFTILVCFNQINSEAKSMNNEYIPAEYVIISDNITADLAEKLSKRYDMRVVGVRGGLADCVNILGLSFQIQGPLTKDELRKILVDCVEEFLFSINSNEKLRPSLRNYPFTAEGISIELFVIDRQGRTIYDPEIGVAVAKDGKLGYKTTDRNDTLKYKSRSIEDYEAALKIVREMK